MRMMALNIKLQNFNELTKSQKQDAMKVARMHYHNHQRDVDIASIVNDIKETYITMFDEEDVNPNTVRVSVDVLSKKPLTIGFSGRISSKYINRFIDKELLEKYNHKGYLAVCAVESNEFPDSPVRYENTIDSAHILSDNDEIVSSFLTNITNIEELYGHRLMNCFNATDTKVLSYITKNNFEFYYIGNTIHIYDGEI